jgi:hypothetical protein
MAGNLDMTNTNVNIIGTQFCTRRNSKVLLISFDEVLRLSAYDLDHVVIMHQFSTIDVCLALFFESYMYDTFVQLVLILDIGIKNLLRDF